MAENDNVTEPRALFIALTGFRWHMKAHPAMTRVSPCLQLRWHLNGTKMKELNTAESCLSSSD